MHSVAVDILASARCGDKTLLEIWQFIGGRDERERRATSASVSLGRRRAHRSQRGEREEVLSLVHEVLGSRFFGRYLPVLLINSSFYLHVLWQKIYVLARSAEREKNTG